MFIGILINSQNFDFKNQILHDVISYKQFLWHRHSGYGIRGTIILRRSCIQILESTPD